MVTIQIWLKNYSRTYDIYINVQTHPGSFGTSSVPGGNDVTIDCVDPMAGVVAGLSIMIICK